MNDRCTDVSYYLNDNSNKITPNKVVYHRFFKTNKNSKTDPYGTTSDLKISPNSHKLTSVKNKLIFAEVDF